MQAPKSTSSGGPERLILGLALLVPLGIAFGAALQLPMSELRLPSMTAVVQYANVNSGPIVPKRPAPSNQAPPPTLALPTPTPLPTATPVPPTKVRGVAATAQPTATAEPKTARTYTVQRGDELKHIAAQYGVSIWKIIAANDIPNPDSLRIGQVLKIPDE